jgi:hypothetical protein
LRKDTAATDITSPTPSVAHGIAAKGEERGKGRKAQPQGGASYKGGGFLFTFLREPLSPKIDHKSLAWKRKQQCLRETNPNFLFQTQMAECVLHGAVRIY